jgi:hypothetical protein
MTFRLNIKAAPESPVARILSARRSTVGSGARHAQLLRCPMFTQNPLSLKRRLID